MKEVFFFLFLAILFARIRDVRLCVCVCISINNERFQSRVPFWPRDLRVVSILSDFYKIFSWERVLFVDFPRVGIGANPNSHGGGRRETRQSHVTWGEGRDGGDHPFLSSQEMRKAGRFVPSIWFTIMIIWPLPNWTCRHGQRVSFFFFSFSLTHPWKWIHRLYFLSKDSPLIDPSVIILVIDNIFTSISFFK